ncbi:MAG: hypothetical protein MZW92_50305 [Comamonadaceae bacterium]|nr:hypothetical protein [Comamonadaceae bacterium]
MTRVKETLIGEENFAGIRGRCRGDPTIKFNQKGAARWKSPEVLLVRFFGICGVGVAAAISSFTAQAARLGGEIGKDWGAPEVKQCVECYIGESLVCTGSGTPASIARTG